MYTYKTIPAPMELVVKREDEMQGAICNFSQIINKECVDGWEFYSMETITTSTAPGCLGISKAEKSHYNMLVFRRPLQSPGQHYGQPQPSGSGYNQPQGQSYGQPQGQNYGQPPQNQW